MHVTARGGRFFLLAYLFDAIAEMLQNDTWHRISSVYGVSEASPNLPHTSSEAERPLAVKLTINSQSVISKAGAPLSGLCRYANLTEPPVHQYCFYPLTFAL